MFKRYSIALLVMIGTFLSAPCKAADEDSQIWSSVTLIAPVTKKLDASVEYHARFTEDASVLGQRLFRPSITYKLHDNLSVTGGYFFGVNNTPRTESSHEHRLWQQIGYTFIKTQDGVIFGGRTRLEQRFVESEGDTGWRLRQQLRLQTPLPTTRFIKGLLWNETFIGLNDTDWGQRADFDQTRSFFGLVVPVTKNTVLEPGYLNQIVFRSGTDRINHIAAVNLTIRF